MFAKNYKNKNYIIAIIILVFLGLSTRLLPHLPNFTAIGAVAIFSGRYISKKWALLLPLMTMFLSDIVIGFYSTPIMISVYAGFIVMVYLGYCTKQKNWQVIANNTIIGSLLFYLITNGAVWAFGTMYPHTAIGLTTSYYMALPFFRNSLLADIIYTTILVGGFELLTAKTRQHLSNSLIK